MSRDANRRAIIEFLNTVVEPGHRVDGLPDDCNLMDAGLLDSFAAVQVILHLEERYSVDLQETGIDPASLNSIGGILDAIDQSGRR